MYEYNKLMKLGREGGLACCLLPTLLRTVFSFFTPSYRELTQLDSATPAGLKKAATTFANHCVQCLPLVLAACCETKRRREKKDVPYLLS